ncbi:hypothetical protein QYM36_019168 [Artemia franciscana]|uniref:Uncharacterized protein n=1 Tax=Artemia franciscana TaxID=6661 RepID=A0AA88KTQ3_ARTSF|nr:hypothetical protein QYM36_019168 [Artemia franciscana]
MPVLLMKNEEKCSKNTPLNYFTGQITLTTLRVSPTLTFWTVFLRNAQKPLSLDIEEDTLNSVEITPTKLTRSVCVTSDFDYKLSCLFCTQKGSTKKKSLNVLQARTGNRQWNILEHAKTLWQDDLQLLARCVGQNLITKEGKVPSKVYASVSKEETRLQKRSHNQRSYSRGAPSNHIPPAYERKNVFFPGTERRFSGLLISSGVQFCKSDLKYLTIRMKNKYGDSLQIGAKKGQMIYLYLKEKISAGNSARQVSLLMKKAKGSDFAIEIDVSSEESADPSLSSVPASSDVSSGENDDPSLSSVTASSELITTNDLHGRRSSMRMRSNLGSYSDRDDLRSFCYVAMRLQNKIKETAKVLGQNKEDMTTSSEFASCMIPPCSLIYWPSSSVT